ncbi:MAG: hypothetical protein WAV01_02130 [Candidatus Saccharimonadales bacterium]
MELEIENAKLRAFAQDVMEYWPGSDIDNDLEQIAVLHGLLKPELRNTPCADSCYCAKNINENDWVEGVICYRKTALLTGEPK